MSILSHEGSQSRQLRRMRPIDQVLTQKMQSLTQNLKKVSQTKQVLEDSFHQSRYTYSELQKMHNNLFYKYKACLGQIQGLEQQITQQSQVRELLQKQNDQLYSYFSDNGFNLSQIQQSIMALKQVKDKYEVEKSALHREQQINKQLVKIVEECLQKIQEQAERNHYSRGRYQKQTDDYQWQMIQRMSGFLEFITHNRDQLLPTQKQTSRSYPQNDSVKEIPSPQYHLQIIDPKQLFLPQLKQNTEKDEQMYLKEKYSNPYVSELLEKISERSRQEVTDRSGLSSSQRVRWQEQSQVRKYEVTESRQSFRVDSSKLNQPQQTRIHQRTPQHLYSTLMSIQKKFTQLQLQSAQQKALNLKQKQDLTLEIKQLQQIVIRSREDILQMQSEIMEKTTKMTKMRHELQQKQTHLESIDLRLRKTEKEIHELRKEVELERETNKELVGQVREKQKVIEKNKNIIVSLEKEVQRLNSENQHISQQVNKIKQILDTTQSKQRQVLKTWTSKLQSWKRVALQNQTQNKSLSNNLSNTNQEIQRLNDQNKSLSNNLSSKNQEIQRLSERLQESFERINQLNLQRQDFSRQMIRAKKAQLIMEENKRLILDDVSRLKNENSQLQSKMKSLNQNNQSLKQQHLKLNEQVCSLRKQLRTLNQQKQNLSEQLQTHKYQHLLRKSKQKRTQSQQQSNNDSFHSINSNQANHQQKHNIKPDVNCFQLQQLILPQYAIMNEHNNQHYSIETTQRHYSMLISQKDTQIHQFRQQVQNLNQLIQQLKQRNQQQPNQPQNNLLNQGIQQTNYHQDKYPQKPLLTTQLNQPQQSLNTPIQHHPQFPAYNQQKQQQIHHLQQIITQKIHLFQTKLTQEQQNNHQQNFKLTQLITNLQTHNHLLIQELNHINDKFTLGKEENQILRSQVQKLKAKMFATDPKNEEYDKMFARDPKNEEYEVRQSEVSPLQIRQLQQTIRQKNAQIDSLTLTLQKLKLQLQKANFTYETSLKALEIHSQDQLHEKQNDLQDIQRHYQRQYQKVKQSYQSDIFTLKRDYDSLNRQRQNREEEFVVKMESLRQAHSQETSAIYASAQEKITSLKQLNKKARRKLIEQEHKIESLQHNLSEFSHLLNQKDLVLQDLVHKISLKDQQIHQLFKNSHYPNHQQPQPNPIIKSAFCQLQTQLQQKINSLQTQLLSAQQTHSKNESTLRKLIDQLRFQNCTLRKQNQDLSKAYQRQSIVNQQKLRYISLQMKKQKLMIHTLTVSYRLTPEVEWGNKIQAQIMDIDSPINEIREQFFKAKKSDPISELNKLKKKYSREKYQKQQNTQTIRPTQSVVLKPPQNRPMSQMLPNNDSYARRQHQQSQDEYFQAALMKSSRERLQNAVYHNRKISQNLPQRQLVTSQPHQGNFILMNDFPTNPMRNVCHFNKPPYQSRQSIPRKDDQFIMIKSPRTINDHHDVFYDFTDPPKLKLKQSPSMQIGLNQQQTNHLLYRKHSINSQNSYASQPQLCQNNKNSSDREQLNDPPKYYLPGSPKRPIEMSILQQTIKRKKQQNQTLLRQIKYRNNNKIH